MAGSTLSCWGQFDGTSGTTIEVSLGLYCVIPDNVIYTGTSFTIVFDHLPAKLKITLATLREKETLKWNKKHLKRDLSKRIRNKI